MRVNWGGGRGEVSVKMLTKVCLESGCGACWREEMFFID